MKDFFFRVAAASPLLKVADVEYNVSQIRASMEEAAKQGAELLVFPELCITGYTCGDLFLQDSLVSAALCGLLELKKDSLGKDMLIFVGLPLRHRDCLYNTAAVLYNGRLLGVVPKSFIPEYGEFYEKRYFSPGPRVCEELLLCGESVCFGTDQMFCSEKNPEIRVACEICEDLWVPLPPSTRHALAGANIIANLSASNELAGKSDYRRTLVEGQSARLYAVYVYASSGFGESTTDTVYSGHRLICENGILLSESKRFELPDKASSDRLTIADADVGGCLARRKSMTTYFSGADSGAHIETRYEPVETEREEDGELWRYTDPHPFVPEDESTLKQRCDEILGIASMGLVKRIEHTGAKKAVIGISGGLDSTLALLITVMAFERLGRKKSDVLGITMPGFGTTDRTYENACKMVNSLGATLIEIPIADSVRKHFSDIGHDESVKDVTYENAQARERTQILMDVANQNGGMVIGTGDLSELALGWSTYNGDHMSMYGVNAGIPKTLVRHLVHYYASYVCDDSSGLKKALFDVLDTPVSPELLPPENGKISQKTEDLVGPYELHDFFLYYVIRYGFSPKKIYRLAKKAFSDKYDGEIIKKWMGVFYRRFFAQQFKRSCLPDGPKVGTVAISPRGDWRMPSDASAKVWLAEIENMV